MTVDGDEHWAVDAYIHKALYEYHLRGDSTGDRPIVLLVRLIAVSSRFNNNVYTLILL